MGVGAGWVEGPEGGNWDNCNSVNNKICFFLKEPLSGRMIPQRRQQGAGLGPEMEIWACLGKPELGKQTASGLALTLHIVTSLGVVD